MSVYYNTLSKLHMDKNVERELGEDVGMRTYILAKVHKNIVIKILVNICNIRNPSIDDMPAFIPINNRYLKIGSYNE